MNRRDAIKMGLGVASVFTGASKTTWGKEGQQSKKRANILFLMCDQLNAGVLGCYGGPIPTPNLDRLCHRGVRFTNAACAYPLCSPNRATIITGQYPHTHGIVDNVNRIDYPAIASPPSEQGITVRDNTTGKLLHAAGYDTHQYGKWHLHGDMLPWYPDTYGEHLEYAREMAAVFEKIRKRPRDRWMNWYGWALPVAVNPVFERAVDRLGSKWDQSGAAQFVTKAGRLELPLEQMFDIRVSEHGVSRLHALTSKPFMMTVSWNHPHDPNVIPSPYYNVFQPSNVQIPANFANCEKRFESDWSRKIVADLGMVGLRELLRIYYDSVLLIDNQVGFILDALETTGRIRDTVVVFTTDHGDMAGGHGMFWKSTSAFYDEIVRVPLIISYPWKVKPRVSNLPVSSVDLMPTLLELAGQDIPQDVQGRSIAPYLLDELRTDGMRKYVFCERIEPNRQHTRHVSPGTPASFMVRGEGWKYIRYADGGEYLYDHSKDPGETQNLASNPNYSDSKKILKRKLEEWLAETGFPRA